MQGAAGAYGLNNYVCFFSLVCLENSVDPKLLGHTAGVHSSHHHRRWRDRVVIQRALMVEVILGVWTVNLQAYRPLYQ